MMYLDRLARVAAPLAYQNGNGGAGDARVVPCNNATTPFRLDNDILQFGGPGIAAANAAPGSYGRALVRFHAEGNDLYLNFDRVNTVVANSAATAGNTRAMRIPAGQERDFELDPFAGTGSGGAGGTPGLWCSATTINGQTLTATLRYQVVSFPSQGSPASG